MNIIVYISPESQNGQIKINPTYNRFVHQNLKESIQKIKYLEWVFPQCYFVFDKNALEPVLKFISDMNITYEVRNEIYSKDPVVIKKQSTKDFSKGLWQSKEKIVKISEIEDDIFELDFPYIEEAIEVIKDIDSNFRVYDFPSKKWKISGAKYIEEVMSEFRKRGIAYKV
jgi:hypothetical protein